MHRYLTLLVGVWNPLKNVERTLRGFSEPLLMKPRPRSIVFEHKSRGSCAYQKGEGNNLTFSEQKPPTQPSTNTLSMWVWLAPLLTATVSSIGFVIGFWTNCSQRVYTNDPPNENDENNQRASTRFTSCSEVINICNMNLTSNANRLN